MEIVECFPFIHLSKKCTAKENIASPALDQCPVLRTVFKHTAASTDRFMFTVT
jgi:hypothetical protein